MSQDEVVNLAGFQTAFTARRVRGPAPSGTKEFGRRRSVATSDDILLEVVATNLVVEVKPSRGKVWFGQLACGAEGASGIYATPNPEVTCIVASGQGYWIPVADLSDFRTLRTMPIKQVLQCINPRLIMFVGYTHLSAY